MSRPRVVPLTEVASIHSGSTPSRSRQDYWGGMRPWVSAKDMKTRVVSDSHERLTESGYAVASVAPAGAILILTRGMTLFKDVPVCLAAAEVAFNQDVKALVVKGGTDPAYLAHYLRARRQTLMALVDSAGHGTGRLNTDALAEFPVMRPTLAEQRRVASILTTWDEGIDSLQRLARAKASSYSWLRRQLIDKPAAEGAWSHVPLGRICQPITRKNVGGATRVLTSSGRLGLVDQSAYFRRDVSGADLTSYYLLKGGEFAYNRSASAGYPYGAIKRLDRYDEGVLSTLYLCFGLEDQAVSSDFLCHFFESGVMNSQLGQICQVGSRAHGLLNVTKPDFFSLTVAVPSRREQERIVGALDTAAREVNLLRSQVEFYSLQKRGLMARLFFGGSQLS